MTILPRSQSGILGCVFLLMAGACFGESPPTAAGDEVAATYREIAPFDVSFETFTALRLRADGHLLAADGPGKHIKIISPQGKVVGRIELPLRPEAFNLAADGSLYCGGEGQLTRLSPEGEVLKTVSTPADVETKGIDRRRARGKPVRISGIAVSDRDVFVAFGSGWSTGSKSKLYRFGLDWESPKLLDEGLRGCCQRCDITVRDGKLYLAENSAHRVVIYDREGNKLSKWGTRSRTNVEGFGACCNPMNLCFDREGNLFTSESGLGRIKVYSADGAFQELVGHVDTERFERGSALAASCSNIALAVAHDKKRVYVMDFKKSLIRVLEKKGAAE